MLTLEAPHALVQRAIVAPPRLLTGSLEGPRPLFQRLSRPAPEASGRVTGRRWIGGVLFCAMLPLAACGSEEPTPEQAAPTAPSSSAAPRSATPEERAAESATKALENLLRVSDRARQEPTSGDWEPEIRRYAADPAAFTAVQSVRDFATLGLRQNGDTGIELEVTDVQLAAPAGPSVRVRGCYDSSSAQVINVDTDAPVPPRTAQRYVWDVSVVQHESEPGAPWLVTQLDPYPDQPC